MDGLIDELQNQAARSNATTQIAYTAEGQRARSVDEERRRLSELSGARRTHHSPFVFFLGFKVFFIQTLSNPQL
jgi:hypothetical protein